MRPEPGSKDATCLKPASFRQILRLNSQTKRSPSPSPKTDQGECPVRKTARFPSSTSTAPPRQLRSNPTPPGPDHRGRDCPYSSLFEQLRATRCRNGKEGSVYAGGGLLTEAARLAGYQPAFAIEINSDYAAAFEENHTHARMFNLSVEDVPVDELPPVELLTLGIPCEPYSMARRRDRITGAKRNRTLPPEAHPLSDLTIWAALLIRKLNPATVVIEEAPGYLTSGAGFMIRFFLERAGYTVEARVLDPREYGELSARIRSVIVAHSGSNFRWPEPILTPRTFAEIRDPEGPLENHYFTSETKPWPTNHWANQTAKGNGFTSTELDNESTSVPCVSKRYFCNLKQFLAATRKQLPAASPQIS